MQFTKGSGKSIIFSIHFFFGRLDSGTIEGRGTMVWPNGQIYEGFWKGSERSGRGRNMY